jgi:hypothetical protein
MLAHPNKNISTCNLLNKIKLRVNKTDHALILRGKLDFHVEIVRVKYCD